MPRRALVLSLPLALLACTSESPQSSSEGGANAAGNAGSSAGGVSSAGTSSGAGGAAGKAGGGGVSTAGGSSGTAGQAGDSQSSAGAGGASGDGVCSNAYIFCDDFESEAAAGPPNPADWSVATWNGGALEIDDTVAAQGTHSLKLTTPNHPATAYARHTGSFPLDPNAFYGRLFFRVEAPGPKDFVHWNLIEATGPDDATDSTKLIRYGGVSLWEADGSKFIFNRWLFNFEMQPRPVGFDEFGSEDQDSPPFEWGAFRCMEWRFDQPAKTAELWIDGTAIDKAWAQDMIADRSVDMPIFDGLNVGWALYQDVDAGYTVWVDSVALDEERIGCPALE